MFVDRAKIQVNGGDGGNGCCSFRREKYVPKGGPSGGDGGDGGSVFLVTASGEQSLVDLVFNRHFRGGRGEHGRGKDQHGHRGKDCYLRVPIGTVVKDVRNHLRVIVDLDQPDQSFLVARGGRGGRGNMRFMTSTHRAPFECEEGQPGEELELELELKSIADVGLVGYPNAGKSTLLRALSKARPKVAPYPFTTLHPVVGVVEFQDYSRFTVADIPGLIDGAHNNIGLGHDFLRHIERTKILAYVLDTAGVDGRRPWEDFASLQKELELYMAGLSGRPGIVIANKMDLEQSRKNLRTLKRKVGDFQIFPLSAESDQDFSVLTEALRKMLADLKPATPAATSTPT